MEQEPKEKQAVCSSAPASGYATAVDAALHLATSGFTCARFQNSAKALGVLAFMKNGDIYSEVAAKVLAEEVLRLRASAALREEIIEECADEIEPPPEWWRDETRCGYADRFKARMELRIKCVAVRESHNEVAHPRREVEGGAK